MTTYKKTMLLHTYEKNREPVTAAKSVYVGKPGANKKADIVIAETPLYDFAGATSADLGWPFDVLESYQHIPQIVLTLPDSFHQGNAKGYLLDLMDFARDRDYHVFNAKVRYHQFGAPIMGSSMFMVLSREPMSPIKSFTTVEEAIGRVYPDIITHATVNPGNIAFISGAGTMNGFRKSNTAPLPEIFQWGGNLLMCERRDGSTVTLSRITFKELSEIYGMEVTEISDLNYLLKAVPLSVYNTFINRFLMD